MTEIFNPRGITHFEICLTGIPSLQRGKTVLRRNKVKNFLIACFAATSLLGFATGAGASPVQNPSQPITVAANATQPDAEVPYMLAKLHEDIQMLQTEVQTLGSLEGQAHGSSQYFFSAAPNGSTDSVGG
jgi:hypothetical protein